MVRVLWTVYNGCHEEKMRPHSRGRFAFGYGGTKMKRISTRGVVGVLALMLAALLLCDLRTAQAQAKKSDSVVKVDAKTDKPDADGKQTITITLDIENGWHIYANPVENEDLTNAQTVVSVTSKGKLEDVKVEYPAGKLQKDNNEKFKIYEGKVAIKVQVKRAGGDTSPLEITVKLQACNDKTCLPPVAIKKEVP
jgi:DsbC/DsbD-like thiol-disulfide interchange protein